MTANQDPNSSQFDDANFTLAGTHFFSARAGTSFDKLQVSAFVDNLTDSHALTDYNTTINPLVPGVSRLQRFYAFRPRTFGITLIYRQ